MERRTTTTKCAPAFDFYPERWTHGTRHMTKTERCDYLDLLCHQWTENGLPDDLDMLSRLLGYKKTSQIPELVLEKFPVAEDGRRRNRRLEDERTKQIARIDKKRFGAQITNEKRWGKRVDEPSHSDRIATPERVACESPPPTSVLPPPSIPPNPQGGDPLPPKGEFALAAEPKPKRERIRFCKPTAEEWQTYAATLTPTFPPAQATLAYGHYESNGWKVGRNPMQDWRAALRTCHQRWRLGQFSDNGQHNGYHRQPKYPAYDPESATRGKTPDQIGTF